jgi:hypothetical protein
MFLYFLVYYVVMTQAQLSTEQRTQKTGGRIAAFFGRFFESKPKFPVLDIAYMYYREAEHPNFGGGLRIDGKSGRCVRGFFVKLVEFNRKSGKVTVEISNDVFGETPHTVRLGEEFTFISLGREYIASVSRDPTSKRKLDDIQVVGLNYRTGHWDGNGDSSYTRVFRGPSASFTAFLARLTDVNPTTGEVTVEVYGIPYIVSPGKPFIFKSIFGQDFTGVISLG